ncbi:hypothetical protein [Terrihabitans sp. B22-R8]|uniref:hypothetical protein n=1 Tax=Terrihabitans sp. B22-R8 TaxID=3425128 RepID=UPI00403CFAFF
MPISSDALNVLRSMDWRSRESFFRADAVQNSLNMLGVSVDAVAGFRELASMGLVTDEGGGLFQITAAGRAECRSLWGR